MGTIIGYIVTGLIVGAIASLLVPGRTPGGLLGVILLGIAGALLAGPIFDRVILSFITAMVASVGIPLVLRRTAARPPATSAKVDEQGSTALNSLRPMSGLSAAAGKPLLRRVQQPRHLVIRTQLQEQS